MSTSTTENGKMISEVKRSSAEIRVRMERLKEQVRGYDVWVGSRRDPEIERIRVLYEAKLGELRWILGEDVKVDYYVD